jgi:hypothetical protein
LAGRFSFGVLEVSMTRDLEPYRHHLEPLGLSPDAEKEVLEALVRMMAHFVDAAFGDDPASQALDAQKGFPEERS